FLVVGATSKMGDFNLITLIPDQRILANLPYLQGIIWVITFISLIFIPVGLYFMRQTILIPLQRLLKSMKKVRNGDWNSRVMLYDTSDEFVMLGQSFNSMMDEIQSLRTNVYEVQLDHQREELQRLQLQVNPHFFLNTLNIIYNLAKVSKVDLVLEMTLSLIRYFRFMFRSNTSFVKLKEELEHTRNYLRIQSLRFPDQLTWSIDVPDFLTNAPIPPLIIQSFTENSIKHAVTLDEPFHISVGIDLLEEDGSLMKIQIRDNGPGFPDEVLQALRYGRSVENEQGEHTGIWNVQRRLRLLYGDSVSIHYGNNLENGGVEVEIVLPRKPVMEGS
ncbi:sensor histidine kinase, partial [Paenibacillus sp. 2TAB19]|uniref:sensor histidine kinase n=1 Tax=Paenibacillus sp. 2TAB19 TaxID=3233003 RepID=UPI003F9D3057